MPEYREELQGRLERTGGAVLLDSLGEALPYEKEHCGRVGELAMHVVEETGGRPERILEAGFAGSLHDVGKIDPRVRFLVALVRDLRPEESQEVNTIHTTLGAAKIKGLEVDEEDNNLIEAAVRAAYFHHHKPRDFLNLSGVPDVSMIRVIQIVDKFDAMQDGDRPYHRGNPLSPEEALSDIEALLRDQMAFDNLAESTVGVLRAIP
ncbi:MAG TPA: HD domain-containing protein [Candidatus Saccharimonadales bacterium]|nr:HD domain-containing protein [Candidatus Saccharimonadales bacterium]